jgi:hypothetical protein
MRFLVIGRIFADLNAEEPLEIQRWVGVTTLAAGDGGGRRLRQ